MGLEDQESYGRDEGREHPPFCASHRHNVRHYAEHPLSYDESGARFRRPACFEFHHRLTSLSSRRNGPLVYAIRKAAAIGSSLTPSSALTEPSSRTLSRSGRSEMDERGTRSKAQATDHR